MTIALVKLGAASQAAAATVTPAFGQTTAAGNLLVAVVVASGASVIATASSGWLIAKQGPGTNSDQVAIAYKPNSAGSDAAPTFTSTSATAMRACLAEYSGVATSSPVDQTGSGSSSGNFMTATAASVDTNANDLVIAAFAWKNSMSETTSFTNNTATAATKFADTGATSGTFWLDSWYSILAGTGGSTADTGGSVFNGGVSTISVCGVVVSFLPVVVALSPKPYIVSQAVQLSATR